jgi:hypothetical protein
VPKERDADGNLEGLQAEPVEFDAMVETLQPEAP